VPIEALSKHQVPVLQERIMRLLTISLVLVAVLLSIANLAKGEDASDLDAVAKELKRAVIAGKLTKEEALAKLAALKGATAAKKQPDGPKEKKQSDYQAIEAAVKAGKLTKEEAATKLAALKEAAAAKKQPDGPKDKKPSDDDAIASKLSELVNAGLLSKEQVEAMLAAAKKVGTAKKVD
jgi:hypothetical protein